MRIPFRAVILGVTLACPLASPLRAVSGSPTPAPLGSDLEVHVIDVDQGSATLIVSPTGTTVLVDGGFAGFGNSAIVPYLNALGISQITYGVATHYDADHIGGMDEVFNAGFGPSVLCYDRGNSNMPSNSHVSGYLSSVSGQRATPTPGQTISLGGGAELEFIVVNGDYPGGSVNAWSGNQPENSSSIGLVVRLNDFDCWIGGDLTGGGNSTANVEGPVAPHVGQVEVALANHHGSRTSSNQAFINTLDPSVVIYQAGQDNSYGHPDELVLDRWSSQNSSRVQWCTTDGDLSSIAAGFSVADGSIVMRSGGSSFTLQRAVSSSISTFACFEFGATAAGTSDLRVTELLINPAASNDLYGEWIEVLNIGSGPRHLEGLRVESGSTSFISASKLLLAAGERLVIGTDGRASRNGDHDPDFCPSWNDMRLSDSSSSLTLRTQGGAVIETVQWGGSGFSVTSGASKERINPAGAPSSGNFTDAVAAWSGGDLGTPREVNDSEVPACEPAIAYCTSAPNSVGSGAVIGWQGSFDVFANDLELTATGAPANQFAIFYYGPNPIQVPFGEGFRCVGGGTNRLPIIQISGAGSASYALDLSAPPPTTSGQITPGSTWNFQLWYRDPAGGPSGFNLSDAFQATFCGTPPVLEVGDVIVTEFMADPTFVSDSSGEWFEVTSTVGYSLDLDGWILEDGNGGSHVVSGLTLGAGGRLVFGRSANTSTNGGVIVDQAYGSALTLDDFFGAVRLRSPGGTLIDEVVYQAGFFPVLAGMSSELDPAHFEYTQNDNASNWCSSSSVIGGGNSDTGTPGVENPGCP